MNKSKLWRTVWTYPHLLSSCSIIPVAVWNKLIVRVSPDVPFFIALICSSLEIGFSLFDSFVTVNSYIAWKNHILKGRPEKDRGWLKYGIREARLQLISRWAKRCSRHYQRTKPHIEKFLESEFTNSKGTPVKPHSLYHEVPVKMPLGSSHCVICGAKTKLCCWGCGMDLQGIFPVCPTSKRDCFQQMHQIRNGI